VVADGEDCDGPGDPGVVADAEAPADAGDDAGPRVAGDAGVAGDGDFADSGDAAAGAGAGSGASGVSPPPIDTGVAAPRFVAGAIAATWLA
jgi:hypothetical protein